MVSTRAFGGPLKIGTVTSAPSTPSPRFYGHPGLLTFSCSFVLGAMTELSFAHRVFRELLCY